MEQWSELPVGEKIEALLAVAKRPLPRDEILSIVGLNPTELTAKESADIEGFLARYRVAEASAGEPKYWLTKDEQKAVVERLHVDVKSVHRRIIEVAMAGVEKNRSNRGCQGGAQESQR